MTKKIDSGDNKELFHAYVIGGGRDGARDHVEELLADFSAAKEFTLDRVVSEHVTFNIDSARELRTMQELLPDTDTRRIYIVYADFITREAENALLKTLEEPVERTHIIVCVPKPEVLLPTLLSRVRVIMPTKEKNGAESERREDEAKKFLALSRADRLAHIAKLVEKSDDDDAAAEVRERTLTLMDGLEQILGKDPQTNRAKLEELLRFKKYLYIPGASSRIILETLALTI